MPSQAKLPPPSRSERLAVAMAKHQQGHVEDAAAVYRELVRESPNDVDALHFLGIAFHQMGDDDAALAHLGRALALAPDHADARNNRGNVLKQLGRLDEAETDYRHALAVRPKDANARSNLGTVLRVRGQLDEAIAAFQEVIALAPGHAPAWQNLGTALLAAGRLEEAIAAYFQAMRLAPQSADSYHFLGAVLAGNDRIDEAREVVHRWIELFPDDPRAEHFLAACGERAAPERAPDAYVRAEFDGFAASFEASLARLEYRAPGLVGEELDRCLAPGEVRDVVLDAGCGTGLCGQHLRPRARRLVGVDLSSEMIALARKRGLYDDFAVEELTAYLDRHAAAFDLIASADTLVYFGMLADVLGAAGRALRAAGLFVFTVERLDPARAAQGYRLGPSGRYAHTRSYLTTTLAGAGFDRVSFREVSLRKEAGRWVEGFLVSAARPALG